MPNYDWKCTVCGHLFEAVEPTNITTLLCPWGPHASQGLIALRTAIRLPAAPAFKVTGGTPKFHNTGRTK